MYADQRDACRSRLSALVKSGSLPEPLHQAAPGRGAATGNNQCLTRILNKQVMTIARQIHQEAETIDHVNPRMYLYARE